MNATTASAGRMGSDEDATMQSTATSQDFEAQIATLKEELAKVKAQLASSGARSAAAARRAAASGADHLLAQGEAALDEFRASARDMEQQLIDTVREKPVTSLAIAAGIGFLFALMTRR